MVKTAGGQVLVYEAADGSSRVDVRLERETVWLTQRQMAELFESSIDNVGLHLKNIFADGELDEPSTSEDFSVVQAEGRRQVRRSLKHYNLDAIISVGYRVNSRRGVRFRQWATGVLREHLTRGFSLDRERFARNAAELETALQLVKKAAAGEALTTDQGRGLVEVIARYTQTFLWLQRYDEGLLTTPPGSPGGVLPTLEEAHAAIARLKADLMARGRHPTCSGASAGTPSPPSWAIWSRRCSASPPIPPSRPRPRTCSISSSRTTRFRMATSARARSCSWIFSPATAACCAAASRSSTTWGWRRWRCWWLNPTPRTRT